MLVVFVNVITMCIPYRGMSAELQERLDLVSEGCTTYFIFELALKVCSIYLLKPYLLTTYVGT